MPTATKRRRLTDRDHEILRWIGRHGLVSTPQIAARFFPRVRSQCPHDIATSGVYRCLRRLEAHKLITREQIHLRMPQIIRLTPRGGGLIGLTVQKTDLNIVDVPLCWLPSSSGPPNPAG